MAPVVPEPVRAGIPGLIKPVCLLLAQVICFRDQKQNTVSPQTGCVWGVAEAMQGDHRGWATAASITPGPCPPPTMGVRAQQPGKKGSL